MRRENGAAAGQAAVPAAPALPRLRSLRERQLALLVLSVGVLVSIMDGSAVTVALPAIQDEFGFSQSDLAWVINAYLVTFGGFLLLAGRLGDLLGGKRVFVSGMVLFMAASVVCGLARDQVTLIGARFVQGIGGALLTGVVLSMIVLMFPRLQEQARAFGLYAFVASSAAALGQVGGALLTEWLSWQWIFFINVPTGVLAAVAVGSLLDNERDPRAPSGFDVVGGLTLVSATMLVVFTLLNAAETGWLTGWVGVQALMAVLLVLAFLLRQRHASAPLIPPRVMRSRKVVWSNVVLGLMVAGPSSMFFLCALYLNTVLGFSVLQLGLAFVPAAVAVGVGSLKIAPRWMRDTDAKFVLMRALGVMAAGLALLTRLPAQGTYLFDVLPAIVLVGTGAGLATPPVLRIALADAERQDSGVLSGLVNTTQQIGSALGLAVLAPLSAAVTDSALASGEADTAAAAAGFRVAFVVALGTTLLALLLAGLVMEREAAGVTTSTLDTGQRSSPVRHRDPRGAADADFVALGLGGTGMMAMLWSIAAGRRAVGVELRGDPYMTFMHWTLTTELHQQLRTIDELMVARYGVDRIPRRGDGSLFLLHECFYSPDSADGADARGDEVVDATLAAHIAGPIKTSELVDDRWVDGRPSRSVSRESTPAPSTEGAPASLDMDRVLDRPPVFLAPAEDLLILFRRYLEQMERMDLEAGLEPRCRLFTYHRVVPDPTRLGRLGKLLGRGPTRPVRRGFEPEPDGRVRVRVEAVRELEEKGRFRRIPETETEVLDLGVPELVMIAEGQDSEDARRLGFGQERVLVDRRDGRGPVPAEADYIVGLIAVFVDNHRRRRIASEFDQTGREYWVRQSVVGHDGYVESGWIVLEVPDFRAFDPIKAGLVPARTARGSAEYHGGYTLLIRDYYLNQVAQLTGVPKPTLQTAFNFVTPRVVTVTAKLGHDAAVAPNVVAAGESFGNGSFLDSGGATTGMVGHAYRTYEYWCGRDGGIDQPSALRRLADGIAEDTRAWLRASEEHFHQPVPGETEDAATARRRDAALSRARRLRRSVTKFDRRDGWSRLNVVPGRLTMMGLQELDSLQELDRQPEKVGSD